MTSRAIWVALATLWGAACVPASDEEVPPVGTPAAPGPDSTLADAYVRPSAEGGELVQGDTIPELPSWTRQDWEVLRRTVAWAWQNGVDSLPIGERIARIGETFVGTPYLPQTLDPLGSERLVVNLRALDCVTFVENALALAHFVTEAPRDVLDRPAAAMRLYQAMLTKIRYRDGRLDGYPSRLHYFTDWLRDNERRGVLTLVTDDLGGVVDPESISFMSSHRDAYRQLEEDRSHEEVGRTEERLNQTPRTYIPEAQVAAVADRIQNGDILATTSTVEGLDIAHTGIAFWKNGSLRLLNAPLVGKSVEISEQPLPQRLLGIRSQDGLMVGRPLDRPLQ